MAARLGLTPEALTFESVNPACAGENADQAAPTLTRFNLGLSDSTDPGSWRAIFSLTDTSGAGNGSFSGRGYGRSSWIGNIETDATVEPDPGLITLAYSGDTTGNGGLSSLDASRVQQQVVGLPVDAFPDLP